jgi:hypothetical protein
MTSMRIAAGLSLTLLCILLLFPTIAADVNEPITIEIPQLQLQLEPNSFATIASASVDQVLVHVGKSPTQVSPGTLYAKINTQAANTIMTTTTMSNEILCTLDLGHREGFHLHPGRNSIEVSFTDLMNRVHYASFLLQTSDASTSRDQKRVSITPDRPVAGADKFAVASHTIPTPPADSPASSMPTATRKNFAISSCPPKAALSRKTTFAFFSTRTPPHRVFVAPFSHF